MKLVSTMLIIVLLLGTQSMYVAADTSTQDDNLTESEETTRGLGLIVVGTILGIIGYRGGKRIWNNQDESESNKREYYMFKNLMILSIISVVLGILLFVGGVFHIL